MLPRMEAVVMEVVKLEAVKAEFVFTLTNVLSAREVIKFIMSTCREF